MYSIYHDKELGLYSKFTPVHHNAVEQALPLVLDAIGRSKVIKFMIPESRTTITLTLNDQA